MALVMAIGIMTVLAIAGTTAIAYSTSSAQQSAQTRSRTSAFSLAEAGVNNSMAVLNLPTNNALDPETLPKCTNNEKKYSDAAADRTSTSNWRHSTIDGGTVDWCGTLVRKDALWYVTSIGRSTNPNNTTTNVTRTLEATVTVTPTTTQPLNNPVWNYLYAGHTGSTCDQTLNNNISGASRMYVAGNLCLSPNVQLNQSTVIVGGTLDVSNNAAVGASTSMATRVETYIGGNCRYATGSWGSCGGNQDARHIYSKRSDGINIGVNQPAPVVAPPAADFATWYENSIPGPSQTCTTSSGTPPIFDNNYPSRDSSVSSVADLTPVELVLLPRGAGGEHHADRRPHSGEHDSHGRFSERVPVDGVRDSRRRRVHDGDRRLRHHHVDGDSGQQRQHGDDACERTDPGVEDAVERRDRVEQHHEDAHRQWDDLHRRQREDLERRAELLQRHGDDLPLGNLPLRPVRSALRSLARTATSRAGTRTSTC